MNREYSCSSILLVDIVDVSGFHLCIEDMPYTMVSVSPCISFYPTNLYQVDGFLKYEPREGFQNNEALQSTMMVMSRAHSFGLSLGINMYINTKILSPGTLHTNFIYGSHFICYIPINSLHQFYDFHAIFYDRIEVWLEGSCSEKFPMNYQYDIFNMVDRFLLVLIFPTFRQLLLQVLLLISCDEHVFASLELHGWIH
jgi:hypothetical protein